ncbi:hypothetical protein LTR37_013805 [Vermiconidia calcicola]|uniref:Uncharacterized protein n=1 Tax=Vermiconidia calcicola TaxID=1690605 RepID=A0ACC3MVG2_9PEZI|nr:hypothetical protein LTR37_013805 [Vermiconidia calcicola]
MPNIKHGFSRVIGKMNPARTSRRQNSAGSRETRNGGGCTASSSGVNFDFNQSLGRDNPTAFQSTAQGTGKYPWQPASIGETDPVEPAKLEITLGLEFEFILAVNTFPTKAASINYSALTALNMVRAALVHPMIAKCADCGEVHQFRLEMNASCAMDHSRWTVEEDGSVVVTNEEIEALGDSAQFFHFYSIEVKSRILYHEHNLRTTCGSRSDGHIHEISYTQEFEAVLERLHSSFTSRDRRGRATILLNRTCGFHVHVGNGKRGFPLRTVKNVVSTYVANERAIDALHSTSRIGGTRLALDPLAVQTFAMLHRHLEPAAFNMPWSEHFIATTHWLRRHEAGLSRTDHAIPHAYDAGVLYPESHLRDPHFAQAAVANNVAAWLEIVRLAPDLDKLKELQSMKSHSSTLNLNNLAGQNDDAWGNMYQLNTIEFRQHAGTLDRVEVRAWLDTVVSIVHHAHNVTETDFAQLCSDQHWLSPTHRTSDLLETIGCSEGTVKHYKHKLGIRIPHCSYGRDVMQQDMVALSELPADNMLKPLQQLLASKRARDILPAQVQCRIGEKFKHGGYGQFIPEYLERMDLIGLDPQVRQKLTVGWKNSDRTPWTDGHGEVVNG